LKVPLQGNKISLAFTAVLCIVTKDSLVAVPRRGASARAVQTRRAFRAQTALPRPPWLFFENLGRLKRFRGRPGDEADLPVLGPSEARLLAPAAAGGLKLPQTRKMGVLSILIALNRTKSHQIAPNPTPPKPPLSL